MDDTNPASVIMFWLDIGPDWMATVGRLTWPNIEVISTGPHSMAHGSGLLSTDIWLRRRERDLAQILFVNMNTGGGGAVSDGLLTSCGAVRVDGGCLALRGRPAEGGFKPPAAALVEDRCGERRGKSRGSTPAGVSRRDERWSSWPLPSEASKCVRRHQNVRNEC
ncbi:hypothetical protein FRAHR75_1060002 [Frankia sp. Hr75.2]|nr:hypothetical protein FRAHR75_1060002 [Frankia sp. Hr75.2]